MPPSLLADRLLRPSRFAWLMAVLAENHARLERLFAPGRLPVGSYRSAVGEDPVLRLDVLERCRYTVLLRLSHLFADGESPPSAPEALVRLFLDARLSELVGLAGTETDGAVDGAVERKMRLNCFFGKWLQFLEDRGHSPQTLEAWLSAPGLAHGRLVACG